ncbi:MAG: DUF3857 and transglutaminase domain-containing protein [Planctomycetia bacterium]|nr:DUF3857 and transglutaminase domain-containing protein [Planctomycetia bacterium]
MRAFVPRGSLPKVTLLILSSVLPGLAALPGAALDAPTSAPAPMVVRAPSAEFDPAVYDPAQLKEVPAEYLSEHSVFYLLNREVHELSPDGLATFTHHILARVNARDGLERASDWPLWFDPFTESIVLHVAQVHKPDGRVVEAASDDLHFRDENTDFAVFDVSKYLVVSFSRVEVGDVVELKYSRRQSSPQYHGQLFSRCEFYDEEFPIYRHELAVRVPKDKKLTYAAHGTKIEPRETEADGTRTYRWLASKVLPLEPDETLPPDDDLYPGVSFSTWATWDEVAEMERELRRDRRQCTTEIRELVAKITGDCQSDRDKAKALTSWVRANIRYLSIGHNTAGYTPHAPEWVLAKRFGNCLDQSQLLYVMMQEARLSASHVFVNTNATRQILPHVPSLEAEHAVVLCEVGGQQLWIDPTATLTAWDSVRSDLFGRQAYVVDDKHVRLIKLPELSADRNRIEQKVTVTVRDDGSARWHVERTYHEYAAETIRTQLLAVPPGRARAKLVDDYVAYYPTRKLQSPRLDPKHLADADVPYRVEFDFEVPDFVAADEAGVAALDLHLPTAWDRLGAIDTSADRRGPLHVEPFELTERMTIKLPKGMSAPADVEPVEVKSALGEASMKIDASCEKRQVDVVRRVRVQCPRVEIDQLEALGEFLGDVQAVAAVALPLEEEAP